MTSLLICLIEQDDVKTVGYRMYSPSGLAETVKMARVRKLGTVSCSIIVRLAGAHYCSDKSM